MLDLSHVTFSSGARKLDLPQITYLSQVPRSSDARMLDVSQVTFFPQHSCFGSPFLPPLSVSSLIAGIELFRPPGASRTPLLLLSLLCYTAPHHVNKLPILLNKLTDFRALTSQRYTKVFQYLINHRWLRVPSLTSEKVVPLWGMNLPVDRAGVSTHRSGPPSSSNLQ